MTKTAHVADGETVEAEAVSPTDLARAITERIRLGQYAPGQRLVELDLVADFGVGRTRVREALRHLEARGLVVIAPNRGALVRRLSEDDVRELFETREVLEGLAARLVARRGREAAVAAELVLLRESLQEALASVEVGRFLELNDRLHGLLVERSENSVLQSMLAQLSTALFRIQFQRILSRDALAQANAEHDAIIAAILDADEDAAERRMRQHIRTSYALYCKVR